MSVRMQSSVTPTQYINERVVDVPLRILNRGPEYLRSRMMNRDSALFHHNRRSAVELLAESKPQYIKSPTTSPETKEGYNNRLCAGVSQEPSSRIDSGNYRSTEGVAAIVNRTTYWERGYGEVPPPQGPAALSTPTDQRHSQPDRIKTEYHKPESPASQENAAATATAAETGLTGPSDHKTTTGQAHDLCLHYSDRGLIVGREVSDGHVPCGLFTSNKPAVPPKPSIAIKPPVPAKPTHCPVAAVRPSSLSSRDRSTIDTTSGYVQQKQQKRPRYNGTVKVMAMDISCSHSGSRSELKRDIPAISMEEWQDSRTDTSSDRDRQSSQSSVQESATIVRRRHRKAISRSRSDLTKRFSNSSDFSELSAKFHRNSAELEKFFNEMGLDQNILEPMKLGQSAHAQSSSSLNLFESVSCIGSTDARSCLSEESHPSDGHIRHHDGGERTPGGSVVERNARIIKWLCGIKVASSSHGNQQTVQHQKSAD